MNQYQKYKESTVYSMSPGELLIVLFDEAIGRLKKAEIALEDEEYVIFEDCLDRAIRIIRHLTDILDINQPLSWDLRRIYRYLLFDIGRIKAGRKRQQAEIGRVVHILQELRDAFDTASKEVGNVSVHIPTGSGVRG